MENGNARSITQERRDYDEVRKRILAKRQIRARILHDYVPEFSNTSLAEIEALLDNNVEVGIERAMELLGIPPSEREEYERLVALRD